SMTFNYSNSHDGTIDLVDLASLTASVSYSGLEPILANSFVNNLIFNLPATDDNAWLQDDGVANAWSQLLSVNHTFETTTFADPIVSLTVNGGAGNDQLLLLPLDSAFSPATNISLNGMADNDRLVFERSGGGGPVADGVTGGAGT